MVRFVVCCPTSLGENTHMTFTAPVGDRLLAERQCEAIRQEPDVEAAPIGAYGQQSYLYNVKHPLYVNDRPPHVAGGRDERITIHMSKAYVQYIRGQ